MLTPEGTVLMHAGEPYDAAKAHEYYLRTRHLKGRKKGSGDSISDIHKGPFVVNTGHGHSVKLSPQELKEQKAYAAHRTAQIKAKLSKLRTELHAKLKKAEEAERKAKMPKTAKEKAEAAKASKEYAAKHKTKIKTKAKQASAKAAAKPKPKTDTVASLKGEIVKTQANLKAAVAKQRELATAKRNG